MGDPIKEPLALAEVIDETARFSLHGSNVKLQLNTAPDLPLVEADRGQMSQVISNLVINGKQAMPDGGTITINAEKVETAAGHQIQIVIQDQGIGIAPQYLDRVFDPYFSTKQQGSGLGLASVYSIINKHDGTITVTSKLDQGTIFTILLPATENTEIASLPAEETETIAHTTVPVAHILILDDEELVRKMLGTMLEEMGYKIDYAVHGQETVTKYQQTIQDNSPYDIVITDLTIPGGMGGQEAAQEILKLNPQAKIIVSSGYATDPVMAHYEEYGFRGRIAKPYRFAELQKVIQQVLDI